MSISRYVVVHLLLRVFLPAFLLIAAILYATESAALDIHVFQQKMLIDKDIDSAQSQDFT